MAPRKQPPKPEPPVLSAQQKRAYNERLKRCIADVEAFDPQKVTDHAAEAELEALETRIDEVLSTLFGHETPGYARYRSATNFDMGPITMQLDPMFGGGRASFRDRREYIAEGKTRALALLKQAARTIDEQISDEEGFGSSANPAKAVEIPKRAANRQIFIVHGHDEGARETVARFLERLGFEAVILHEQANKGRTIIQKLIDHGDVGFAVVLLTPDDEGRSRSSSELNLRARQNVVLELGYFVGRLGPDRVCALRRDDVEIPSDLNGVVYVTLDQQGAWQRELARELEAADYAIDWNIVMKGR